MLCGMYENAEQAQLMILLDQDQSDFERGFVFGVQIEGALVTNSVTLAIVSIGTVTKGTSAFRSVGKRTFDDRVARALV